MCTRLGTLYNLKHIFFLNPFLLNELYKNSVRTSQETHYILDTKINLLMLFRKIIASYSENHMKHTNTFCGQNPEF
jgi:hypothetical protein